jgi:hypothetical protein
MATSPPIAALISRKKHTGALIFASSGRNSQRRKVFSADGRQHVTNGVGFVHD